MSSAQDLSWYRSSLGRLLVTWDLASRATTPWVWRSRAVPETVQHPSMLLWHAKEPVHVGGRCRQLVILSAVQMVYGILHQSSTTWYGCFRCVTWYGCFRWSETHRIPARGHSLPLFLALLYCVSFYFFELSLFPLVSIENWVPSILWSSASTSSNIYWLPQIRPSFWKIHENI